MSRGTTNALIPALQRVIRDDPNAAVFLFSDHGPGKNLDWSSSTNTDVVERLAIQLAVRLPDGTVMIYGGGPLTTEIYQR